MSSESANHDLNATDSERLGHRPFGWSEPQPFDDIMRRVITVGSSHSHESALWDRSDTQRHTKEGIAPGGAVLDILTVCEMRASGAVIWLT